MGLPTWGSTSEIWGDVLNTLIWGGGGAQDIDQTRIVPDSLLDAPTVEQTLQQISQHLPQGRAWSSKLVQGTNQYALLRSAAAAFNAVQSKIEELAREYNLNLTDELLPEWEDSVGLPDDCAQDLLTLQEQRENVIFRLRKVPIVTKSEFETLGTSLAGVTVTVKPGTEVDGTGDPINYFKLYVGFPESNVGFPYDFDTSPPEPAEGLQLGGFRSDLVFCVFKKIVPASVVVLEE